MALVSQVLLQFQILGIPGSKKLHDKGAPGNRSA